jgi:LPXTG-motif cell wall-anchored protein
MAATPAPTYPAQAPKLTVSANTVAPGGSVVITGTGFQPGSPASVTWTGGGALGAGSHVLGMAATSLHLGVKVLTVDATGAVTTSVRLTSPGDHTITLSGTAADGSHVSLSTVVAVATAGAGGTLPHTGAPILLYTAAGLMLVLLGALVVMAVRNRRRQSAAAAPVAAPVEQPVAH